MSRGQPERTGAGGGGVHLVAAGPEVDVESPDQGGVVVDDQHGAHSAVRPAGAGTRGDAARGRTSRMVSPPPGVGCAVRLPRMASANPRATARPSPRPAVPRSPDAPASPSSRVNGAKMVVPDPAGMPGPWSITSQATVPGRVPTAPRTVTGSAPRC